MTGDERLGLSPGQLRISSNRTGGIGWREGGLRGLRTRRDRQGKTTDVKRRRNDQQGHGLTYLRAAKPTSRSFQISQYRVGGTDYSTMHLR
jgi:hypothetical protein